MTEVVLFHHVRGLTEGVRALADRIRADGHPVHTPDLFEGRTFGSIEEGFGYLQQIGFGAVTERAEAAVADLPADVVYVGLSLGVIAAQHLAQHRPDARGAVLLESCVPPSELGSSWPAGVPVQVHGMDHDRFFADEGDLDAARALVAGVADGELFTYPGDGHLFVDSSVESYDPDATDQVVERMLQLLARV